MGPNFPSEASSIVHVLFESKKDLKVLLCLVTDYFVYILVEYIIVAETNIALLFLMRTFHSWFPICNVLDSNIYIFIICRDYLCK